MTSEPQLGNSTPFHTEEVSAAELDPDRRHRSARRVIRARLYRVLLCLMATTVAGLLVAVFVDQSRDDGPAQRVRDDTAASIGNDATVVQVGWHDELWYAHLRKDDARVFATIARNELARDARTQGCFSFHNRTLYVELGNPNLGGQSEDSPSRWGVGVILDASGSILLIEADTWFDGSPEFAFLVNLIFRTIFLEGGYAEQRPKDSFPVSTGDVERLYEDAAGAGAVSWQTLNEDQINFIRSWIERYNAVSECTPLDDGKLFRSK